MKIKSVLLLSFTLIFLIACTPTETVSDRPAPEQPTEGYILKEGVLNVNEHLNYEDSPLKTIYFAGGCFWGVEAYMERVYGVSNTESGYANGDGENPTYEDVMKETQQFAETVKVTYDPERVSLETLMDYLFRVIDPTLENQQGNDKGVQYRTGIYYDDPEDAQTVTDLVQKEQSYYEEDIMTEAEPLKNFYTAEEYHQDYLLKNPDGYCHINVSILDNEPIIPIEKDEDTVARISDPL